MGLRIAVLLVSLFAFAILAGCTGSPRDLDAEARDREAWARDHNDYRPVAVLTGPRCVQPGALVWYSAQGSHDPDFFGAGDDRSRREAGQDGGVHYEDDASHIEWDWSIHLDASSNRGLGVGIREYQWRIDDGPVLVSPELTDRYGVMDGPVRLPVGFTEAGAHTIRLRVVDWSGETDVAEAEVQVCDTGTGSTIPNWRVTEAGWAFTRQVDVSWMQYGECPIGQDHYDVAQHHMAVPIELLFFMDRVTVEATWEEVADPVGVVSANLNDVDLTLGHCGTGTAWARFDSDSPPLASDLREGGEVSGGDLARNVEITGGRHERVAEFDFNAYLSDEDQGQWGAGTTADVTFVFVPATSTGYGGY